MNALSVGCAMLLAALLAAPVHAGASDVSPSVVDTRYHLKPALLHGTNGSRTAAALRYDGSLRYDYAPWSTKWTAFGQALTQGTLATDWRSNSENLFAEIRGGAFLDLYEPPAVAPPPARGNRDPRAVPVTPQGGHDYGRIEVAPNVRFETDQALRNYNLVYGCRLGYGNLKQTRAWALVPSAYAEWQRVDTLYSDVMRRRGIPEEAFYRWGVIGSWDWATGEDLAPNSRIWRPLGAHFDIRYYRSYDLPSGADLPELRDALYYAGGLNYELTGKLGWVRSVYLTVAHGKLPPVTRDDTMVFVGVVLGSSR